MAIFSHVDMMGPAHRQNQVQALAQKAAQNVLRRQRLRKLIQAGASAAQGQGGSTGMPVRSSMMHPAPGVHGHGRPNLAPNVLQQMIQGAGAPGAPMPGAVNPSGGGFDFNSIPDPTDPHQSPASLPDGAPKSGYGPSGTSGIAPDGSYIGDQAYSAQFPQDNPDSGGAMDAPALPGNGQLIPLGGGLFYDPINDTVTGGSGNAIRPGLQQ